MHAILPGNPARSRQHNAARRKQGGLLRSEDKGSQSERQSRQEGRNSSPQETVVLTHLVLLPMSAILTARGHVEYQGGVRECDRRGGASWPVERPTFL